VLLLPLFNSFIGIKYLEPKITCHGKVQPTQVDEKKLESEK